MPRLQEDDARRRRHEDLREVRQLSPWVIAMGGDQSPPFSILRSFPCERAQCKPRSISPSRSFARENASPSEAANSSYFVGSISLACASAIAIISATSFRAFGSSILEFKTSARR